MTKKRPPPQEEQAALISAARKAAPAALKELIRLVKEGKDERVRNAAAARILDIAHGRPAAAKDPNAGGPPPTIRILPGDEKL